MGCCESSFLRETHPERDPNSQGPTQQSGPPRGAPVPVLVGVPAFFGFSLSELVASTSNFSSESIVSVSGEKAPNLVYSGRLKNGSRIAVKKFSKTAWPDPKQFVVTRPKHMNHDCFSSCCLYGLVSISSLQLLALKILCWIGSFFFFLGWWKRIQLVRFHLLFH